MSDRPEFDHGKAITLVEQLQSAIRVLNQQTHDRTDNAKTIKQNWTGHHADQFFNNEMPRIQKQADHLVRRMEAIIRAVQNADEAYLTAEAEWQRQQPQPSPQPGPAPTPPPPRR